jgi:hypothetical protein
VNALWQFAMLRVSTLLLAFSSASALAAGAPLVEKEVAHLSIEGHVVTLQRGKLPDGGLRLRLIVADKQKHKKPQSLVLYEGGGEDDGPSDSDWKNATLDTFELPDGSQAARIDFEFRVPGDRKRRQVDSFLIAIDDEVKKVLELTTHAERAANKVCRETEQTSLTLDKTGRLYAKRTASLESDLDDDDMPIDRACDGKHPGRAVTYKYDGDSFFQVDPPLVTKKKPVEKMKAKEDDAVEDDD